MRRALMLVCLAPLGWAGGVTAGSRDAGVPSDAGARHWPPFFEACADKREGQACALQLEGEMRQGKCRQGRSKRLLCLPS
jgi:hypothetical protein